jgi:Tol biopolymer transport system component
VRSIFTLFCIALLLLIIGCSGSGNKGPTQPVDYQPREYNLEKGHSVVGCGTLVINPGSSEVINIPNRVLESHFNVTDMLDDPACPASMCIYFILKYYDDILEEYWMDIYLLNPTPLSPWDPRVILLTSEVPDDYDVRNADSWITLFDDDDPPDDRNPFIAMAKDEANQRRLPPFPIWDSETMVMWINPEKEETSLLDFMVEISWPGHCREPYEINNIEFIEPWGKLWKNPLYSFEDSCSVACDVFDWQDNVIEVSIYAPDILGDEDWRPLEKDTDLSFPNRWKIDLEDIDLTDVDPGDYESWFRALSDEPTDEVDHIYQRFYFPVIHYDEEGGGTGDVLKPQFAFLREKDGYSDIYLKDIWLDGAEGVLINTGIYPDWLETEEFRPAISYDLIDASGFYVVFASNKGGQIDIWRVPVSGGIPQKVTDHWADDFGPRFNPDSPVPTNPEIVFYSYRDGNAEIYRTNLFPSAQPTRLTDHFAEDVDPCYSPEGNYIAFSSNRVAWDNYEIFVLNTITSQLFRVTFDSDYDVRPTWGGQSDAVSEIAFMTNRNDDFDIYRFVVGTFEVLPLITLKGDQIDPDYSYDGFSLVFAWEKEEYFNLYTIPWDGSMEFLYQRTATATDEWSPYWGRVQK